MKANSKHVFILMISILLSVLGLIILLRSSVIGFHAAERFLVNRGGMDTNQFNIVIANYIEAYRWAGAILLAIGASMSFATVLKDDFFDKISSKSYDDNDIASN